MNARLPVESPDPRNVTRVLSSRSARAVAAALLLSMSMVVGAATGVHEHANPGGSTTEGVPEAVNRVSRRGEPTTSSAGLERVMDGADRRHLLLRTGIGAAPVDLLALTGLTRAEGIDWIIDGLAHTAELATPPWTREPPPHYHARPNMSDATRQRFRRARDRELGELRRWWVTEMLTTDSPQTERLVFFWHDLFATDIDGTDRATLAMARQNATFRRLGNGSWHALLHAMLRDAALLDFLDADSNKKAAPNENLAREFLELFTLGEGHYEQSDVVAAARALTGHAASDTADLAFRLQTWDRDVGEKTLFGESGEHDGDALLRLVLRQPAAARHVSGRFWNGFIADGEPEPAWLEAVSVRFRESGHELGTLYRDTLSSEAFWAPRHRGAIVRSPLDIVIGTARSLDYPKHDPVSLLGALDDLGMTLFAPPDVGGWREGEAYVTSGALLDRRRAIERIVRPSNGEPGAIDGSAGMMEMAGMSEASATRDAGARLAIRLAAEHYRGPAAWRVSLTAAGETIWTDDTRRLANGHDTERDGRLKEAASLPWRTIELPAPADIVARAETVSVEFLNDFAGPDGDRNLHVDGVMLAGEWLDGADGHQEGVCASSAAIDPGALYCAGTLHMTREVDPGSTDTDHGRSGPGLGAAHGWTVDAVHVRWANSDEDRNRHVAAIALDDVTTPVGDFHRVQFRLTVAAHHGLEFEVDNYACVPDCLPVWPECAWRDAGFAPVRVLSIPFDGRAASARAPCHLEQLDAGTRALFASLARSMEALLRRVTDLPGSAGHRDTLEHLRKTVRVAERPSWEEGAEFVIADAPTRATTAPWLPPIPEVLATSPESLVTALQANGLTLIDVLMAGFADASLATLRAAPDTDSLDAIRTLVRHPAFQVR